MAIQDKIVDIGGISVTVSAAIEALPDGTRVLRLRATAGQTPYEHVQTIAPNPNLDFTQLRADFLAAVQAVAREAAGREKVRTLVEQLS